MLFLITNISPFFLITGGSDANAASLGFLFDILGFFKRRGLKGFQETEKS